jgi:RES domain-containing protein
LSGKGAALYGGRFASVGTRAVFLAESDSAASEEVLARKQRLGGSAQIRLDRYPRIVFGVVVSLERVLDHLQERMRQDAESGQPGSWVSLSLTDMT